MLIVQFVKSTKLHFFFYPGTSSFIGILVKERAIRLKCSNKILRVRIVFEPMFYRVQSAIISMSLCKYYITETMNALGN